MAEKETFSNQANNLRRLAAEKAAQMIENQKALTPEETRQMLYASRVHQTELERQNEELLRAMVGIERENGRLHDIIKRSLNEIYLFDRDTLRFTFVNDGGMANLGYSMNELKGLTPLDITSEFAEASFRTTIKPLLEGEQQRLVFETNHRRKDGTTYHVEIHLQLIESGDDAVFLAVINDITEHQRLELEIQDALEYAENIVETVREPLVVLNPDLRILSANHSFYETFKVTPEETIWNFIYDLGNRQWDIPKLRVLLEEILPHETVFNGYEVEHDFLNIGRKVILLNARQIFRKNIGSHIILLAMEDITERKLAEVQINQLHTELEQRVIERTAQLKGANREMESFAYSVSHDLRAPLRGIDGFSLALLEDYGEIMDEKGKDYLRRVRAATQRMAQLIDDMLKLTRITRSELIFETVELSAIAVSIAEELRSTNRERNAEFVITKGVTTKGDPRLLRVMLGNLLGNAWKFTSGHAEARIEFGVTDVEGKSACFVRDDGAGFDMKYSDKLFTTFQRLHTEKEFPGTGVGLALVQHIIHRHSGTVWAEGAVEQGATFYFTL